jgi:hypothetical protein
VRDSEFRVPRGDVVPALPSSALLDASIRQAETRRHSESMRGLSVRPAGSAPRKWTCASDRQEPGTRDWHWPMSQENHNHMVMCCQGEGDNFSMEAFRGINTTLCESFLENPHFSRSSSKTRAFSLRLLRPIVTIGSWVTTSRCSAQSLLYGWLSAFLTCCALSTLFGRITGESTSSIHTDDSGGQRGRK